MRIGELLVQQGKLTERELARALDEQPHTKRRLCSMLIVRGLLPFDDAARALSAQHRVPCALAKHLDHRNLDVVSLLPADVARACSALPIGRTRAGALVVCVRDPSAELAATLARAVTGEVMMVVAPALRVEPLVAAAYGEHGEDFDVELGSMNVPVMPPMPDMDLLDPDSMRAALTDLDDIRVARDPSQSGRGPTTARTVTKPAPRPSAPTLDVTRLALDRATSRDAATDHAVAYIAGRWAVGLVLAVRGETLVGYRGHGKSSDGIALPMSALLRHVVDTKRTATASEPDLARLLDAPQVTVAPVLVGGHVVALIAVGKPIGDDPADPGDLAQALGRAYERIHRGG